MKQNFSEISQAKGASFQRCWGKAVSCKCNGLVRVLCHAPQRSLSPTLWFCGRLWRGEATPAKRVFVITVARHAVDIVWLARS